MKAETLIPETEKGVIYGEIDKANSYRYWESIPQTCNY